MNTARVIAAVDADIVTVVEAEDRPGLVRFNEMILDPLFRASNREGYPYVLVIDGNDERGIDVAILSRYPITDITTHVFDSRGRSTIFSRDCAEYFVDVPGVDGKLLVMANHFTSKGSDFDGSKRRIFQARRVKEIVADRMSQGFTHIAVCGDLNDTPQDSSVAPLTKWAELSDSVDLFKDRIDPTHNRLGTYSTGLHQLDYILLSETLANAAVAGGIERRGYYAPRTFPSFDTVTSKKVHASDHHCVWVDLDLS